MRAYARCLIILAVLAFTVSLAQGQGNKPGQPLLDLKTQSSKQSSQRAMYNMLADHLLKGDGTHIPRHWIALPELPSGKDEFDWFNICLSMQDEQGVAAIELCARERQTSPGSVTGPTGNTSKLPVFPGKLGDGLVCSKPNGQLGRVSRYEPPLFAPPRQPCNENCIRLLLMADFADRLADAFGDSVPEAGRPFREAADHARDAADAIIRGDQPAAERAEKLHRKRWEEANRAMRAREIRDPWAEEEAREPEEPEKPDQPDQPSQETKPGPDQHFVPPCDYGHAMDWCLKRAKGDLGYCVKYLSDGIFAVTDGKCETVIMPNDQIGMKCGEKDSSGGLLELDTSVGPWGSTKDWCRVARVAQPIAGGESPTCRRGGGSGVRIKFLDTTELQKMLDELCVKNGGLCPEDFR